MPLDQETVILPIPHGQSHLAPMLLAQGMRPPILTLWIVLAPMLNGSRIPYRFRKVLSIQSVQTLMLFLTLEIFLLCKLTLKPF